MIDSRQICDATRNGRIREAFDYILDRQGLCPAPVALRPRPKTWPLASPAWRTGRHQSRQGAVPGKRTGGSALKQTSCDDSGFIGRNRQNLQLSYFNPAMRIPPGCWQCKHNLIVDNAFRNPQSGTGGMFGATVVSDVIEPGAVHPELGHAALRHIDGNCHPLALMLT